MGVPRDTARRLFDVTRQDLSQATVLAEEATTAPRQPVTRDFRKRSRPPLLPPRKRLRVSGVLAAVRPRQHAKGTVSARGGRVAGSRIRHAPKSLLRCSADAGKAVPASLCLLRTVSGEARILNQAEPRSCTPARRVVADAVSIRWPDRSGLQELEIVPVRRAVPAKPVVIVRLGLFTPADVGVLLALLRQYRLAIRVPAADAGRPIWCCVRGHGNHHLRGKSPPSGFPRERPTSWHQVRSARRTVRAWRDPPVVSLDCSVPGAQARRPHPPHGAAHNRPDWVRSARSGPGCCPGPDRAGQRRKSSLTS